MDLFWSKTKNWALQQLQQLSYLKSLHGAVGNEKNSISIHSSLLSYWQVGKKVLIFLVIPFDFFSIMISSASHEWIKMLKYADILLLCSSRMQTKGCWKASQISWQHGLRPPGDLGNIQCERKHVTHEQLEIDFGCQWSPTRVSSSSK